MSVTTALRKALADPVDFAACLPGYQGDDQGRKTYGDFHRGLMRFVLSGRATSLVVPRNHAKSTLFSQILVVWELIRSRGKHRILLTSATLDLAKENAGKIRDILSDDIILDGHRVPLASVFPWVRPINVRDASGPVARFNVEGRSGIGKEASIFTGAPGSNLAGKRPTYIVYDDITNEKNVYTREQRQKVCKFVDQTEALAYSKDTPLRMVSTFWHPEDATVYVGKRAGWIQQIHDIYVDKDPRRSVHGERRATICPAFINAEEANEMEHAHASSSNYAFWASQYRLRPQASEEPVFTEEMWTFALSRNISKDILPGQGGTFLLWDPVSTMGNATKGMDRNGITVVRAIPSSLLPWPTPDPRRNTFVPIFTCEIAGGADQALEQIEEWVAAKRWPNLKSIWIEEIAAQVFLGPWAKSRGRLGSVVVRGQKIPAKDLTLRLDGVKTAMREGYFVIPHDMENGELFRRRFLVYPGDYDDIPASVALLSSYTERFGRLPGDDSPPPNLPYELGGPGPRPRGPEVIIF